MHHCGHCSYINTNTSLRNSVSMPTPNTVIDTLLNNTFISCISDSCWNTYHTCNFTSPRKFPSNSFISNGYFNFKEILSYISNEVEVTSYEIISILGKQSYEYMIQRDTYICHLKHHDQFIPLFLLHCTVIETLLHQAVKLNGVSTVLLKDALNSEVLLLVLPSAIVEMCRYLLLPSGLNLRNVLWHGFMTPTEVDIHFYCLLYTLRYTLEAVIKDTSYVKHTRTLDESRHTELYTPLRRVCCDPNAIVSALAAESLFLLPGRSALVQSAYTDFAHGRHLSCLLKVIPCLEHSLRVVFCLANQLPEYVLAEEGRYYSTLDGFGQRSKHQLLLDPFLHPSHSSAEAGGMYTEINRLPEAVGCGAYSLLVDMFFSDAGPNIRGLLAHGEVDLSSEFDTDGHHPMDRDLSGAACAILVLFSYLSWRFRKSHDFTERLIRSYKEKGSVDLLQGRVILSPADADLSLLVSTVEQWQSLYHPHRMLARDIAQACTAIGDLCRALSCRMVSVVEADHRGDIANEGCEPMSECQFNVQVCDNGAVVSLWEKSSRIHALVSSAIIPSSIREKKDQKLKSNRSIGELTATALRTSENHIKALSSNSHAREWDVFQNLVNCLKCVPEPSLHPQTTPSVPFKDPRCTVDACFHAMIHFLDEHLNMKSTVLPGILCCSGIAKCVKDCCNAILQELLSREEKVITGTAHTSDRRQYMSYILSAGPVTASLSILAILSILYHIATAQMSRLDDLHNSSSLVGALGSVSAMISSFSSCILQHDSNIKENAGTLATQSKKSLDKSLIQLNSALTSKSLYRLINSATKSNVEGNVCT